MGGKREPFAQGLGFLLAIDNASAASPPVAAPLLLGARLKQEELEAAAAAAAIVRGRQAGVECVCVCVC